MDKRLMMRCGVFLFAVLGLCAPARCAFDFEAYAAEQEALIASRVEAEASPLRRLQMEYLQRQNYTARLSEALRQAVRTEQFSSPEVEKLQAERQALQERLRAIHEELQQAGMETERAKAVQAAIEKNEQRVSELRQSLFPKTGAPKAPPAGNP